MSLNEENLPLLSVEMLNLSGLEKHLAGHFQTKWEEKKLSSCQSLAEQMMALLEEYSPSS